MDILYRTYLNQVIKFSITNSDEVVLKVSDTSCEPIKKYGPSLVLYFRKNVSINVIITWK
jgi:hypothetical protein